MKNDYIDKSFNGRAKIENKDKKKINTFRQPTEMRGLLPRNNSEAMGFENDESLFENL